MSTNDTAPGEGRPLSHAQCLIWTGQQLHPGVPLYNMAVAVEIPGRLELPAFRQAFRAVLDASDALRTVFREADARPVRIVVEEFPYDLPVHDFSADADPDARCREFTAEAARENFDLSRRLFSSALLKLGEERHVWFFNQHHLVTDAWGTGVIYGHLGASYAEAVREGRAGHPEIPSYEGLIEFEESDQARERRDKAREFWRAKVAGGGQPPRLYGTARRHASTETIRLSRPLGEDRARRLRELAADPQLRALTPQMTLFNIFSGLLMAWMHRNSGQAQLSLGCLAHNRNLPVFKKTTGVFIELFPLQAELGEEETFLTLNEKVREEALLQLQNAQNGASQPEFFRGFNVVLNFITATLGEFDGRPVKTDWVHCGHGDAGHHLRLQVQDFDDAGEFVLQFDFNEAVFPEPRREDAIGHFFKLLDALLEDPGQEIAGVDLTDGGERRWLLEEFNDSSFALPEVPSVVHLVAEQAARDPGSPAVSIGSETLTRADLAARSSAVAASLRSMGVGRGAVVGLLLPRSVEAVIAILGVLKAGAAYLPIDPAFPEERIRFMLKDAGAGVLLGDGSGVAGAEVPGLSMAEAERGAGETVTDLPRGEDVAYIIYTSGSTGTPKGVPVRHAALLNYAVWAESRYCHGERYSFPLFSPLTFDLTVTSIFVPLVSGGEIVVYPESASAGDFALLDVIEEDRVDMIKLTPSHLAMLRSRDLAKSRVKGLILGGEDLVRDLAAATLQVFGNEVAIYNEYGPTEATVGCMIHRFDPGEDCGGSVPIGVPAGNAQIYLLDRFLHPVPRGVAGEMFIGGRGVADGYLNRPDLTLERFVASPFEAGKRLYRTGDLARINERGVMDYLGRIDNQVKVRGVRMELGEIEAALSEHPALGETAVKLISGEPASAEAGQHCAQCGLPSNYPGASFDGAGVCHLCRRFERYREKSDVYFRGMEELQAIFESNPGPENGYDCMMLLSGGKDSTYAICRLVDLGLRVFAFTLDNGYLSEQAKENTKRVVAALGVDHVFATTPAMNEIFVDSLKRFSNVCNGCFKTVYTLAIKQAREMGIPYVVTGLSRGQFFETRLTEELFLGDQADPESIDEVILDARKAYHRADDAVNRLLDGSCFSSDEIFEDVQFIDFYRYCPDSLDTMLSYLDERVPWVRPTDTGRSTNCLINNAGIYVHKRERGFHNYAFPYSWDVRIGHKKREAALQELDDEYDEAEVRRMLEEIGYDPEGEVHQPQLVAYYVAASPVAASEVRAWLAGRLPGYMVPAHFVQMDRMPLTSNGKLNRDALPAPREPAAVSDSEYSAPRTPTEELLAKAWTRVLRLDRVGIHDDFLGLGGDSIMAIQIVSRFNESGFRLSPGQLLMHPTIAELAPIADATQAVVAEQGAVSGAVVLTPVQRWFFECGFANPDHWNQSLVVSLPSGVGRSELEAALSAVIGHHDVLRTRFERRGAEWEARIGEEAEPVLLREGRKGELEKIESQLHGSLDLAAGRLVGGALLEASGAARELLLVVHHLVIDAVSWPILLADLATALEQAGSGQPLTLPRKSSSFQEWASGLDKAAGEIDEQTRRYWCDAPEGARAIPRDEVQGEDLAATQESVTVELSREESTALLQDLPREGHVQPNETLLAALAWTVKEWTGGAQVAIELEGHGREELVEDADVTRTVGWFTARFPFRVDLAGEAEAGALSRAVKECLRSAPQRGASYGMLRYLSPDQEVRSRLAAQFHPEILFNYLGLAEGLVPEDSPFRMVRPLAIDSAPGNRRTKLIEVNAMVVEGRVRVIWEYSRAIHRRESIENQTAVFTKILRELLRVGAQGGLGPSASDFPHAKLDANKMSKLAKALGNLK